jgi:hypothetical protein
VEHDSHVVFGKKIPWQKQDVQNCDCCDATATSFADKVRREVFAHFRAVAVKHHSSMQN